jgi:hypothetical protein
MAEPTSIDHVADAIQKDLTKAYTTVTRTILLAHSIRPTLFAAAVGFQT